MHHTDLFGAVWDCACGRRHRIVPERAILADDAPHRLAAEVAGRHPGARVGLLCDRRTRAAAGDAAAAALGAAGLAVDLTVVPDRPGAGPAAWPVCDDATLARLEDAAPASTALVAAGGGVIGDLAKWLAFRRDLPYYCLATAASMNGYASANVAPTVDGVKTLVRARPPLVVAAALPVLRAAPTELTAAGLGDILAKTVSSTDWYLNHLLFGDYFCRRSVELIAEIEPLYLDRPAALAAGEDGALAALFEGLLLTGVAMTMAETSAPSSGGEHLVSHALDMLATARGAEHDLHGRQVGVGTVLAAELYRRVLAVDEPQPVLPDEDVDPGFWGPLTAEVTARLDDKRERQARAVELIADRARWEGLRRELATWLRPPERIAGCLRAAGAAHRAVDIGVGRDELVEVLRRCHRIRSRFTILDLARILGVLPDAAEEIVDAWVA